MPTVRTIICPRCKGEGVVPTGDTYAEGFLNAECPACDGEGWWDDEQEDDEE